jgi:hypothetical protein
MIQDKLGEFHSGAAYDATSEEVDLGGAFFGGENVEVHFISSDIEASGGLTINIQDSATQGSGHATKMAITVTQAEARAGVRIPLCFPMKRYLMMTLTGATAGADVNSAIVECAQTAV